MEKQKLQEIELHKNLVKEYERRYEKEYAQIYNDFWNDTLLRGIPVKYDFTVLDCGCGNGALLAYLSRKFKNAIGMDLSLDLARQINLSGANARKVVIGDAEGLPFREGYFDIIISRATLHHLPSPAKALREIHQKLKPGGFFILSEPCNDSLILRIPRSIYKHKSDRFTIGHKAFYSRELNQLLTDTGFKIKEIRNFGLFAFPLCGLPDFLPIMNFLIFRKAITRILIFFDEMFCRIPLLRKQSWHIIVKAER